MTKIPYLIKISGNFLKNLKKNLNNYTLDVFCTEMH